MGSLLQPVFHLTGQAAERPGAAAFLLKNGRFYATKPLTQVQEFDKINTEM
jgi:hypothetical protein